MKSLNQPGVVGSGSEALGAECHHEVVPKSGLELVTSILAGMFEPLSLVGKGLLASE